MCNCHQVAPVVVLSPYAAMQKRHRALEAREAAQWPDMRRGAVDTREDAILARLLDTAPPLPTAPSARRHLDLEGLRRAYPTLASDLTHADVPY